MRGILVFLFFVFSVAQATTGLNKAPNLQEMKWGLKNIVVISID